MNRWHLNHEYTRNHMFPVLDPGFDELDGELTLAQIRDPVLTWAQMWNPVSPTGGDPDAWQGRQRDTIATRRYRLDQLNLRFDYAFMMHIPRERERLARLAHRFLMAQLKTYPKFNFQTFPAGRSLTFKCNKCVPYNWQFTRNYWGTGQDDQFREPDGR